MPHSHSHFSDWADRAGIWASVLCLVHCALTPVLLIALPGLFVGGDRVHIAMAIVLPVLSLAAFIPGFRQHGQWAIAAIGSAGLSLILGALWSRTWPLETALTMAGSTLLIGAHWRNRLLMCKFCKFPKTPGDD